MWPYLSLGVAVYIRYLNEELPVLLDVPVCLLVLLPLLSLHGNVDVHPQLLVFVPTQSIE